MTYRDPNEPVVGDAPTEAYRAPGADATPGDPPPSSPATDRPVPPPASQGDPVLPAATVPASGPRGGRPSRARWGVALVVVALVVAGSAAAFSLLTAKAPDASVLGWVPRESVAYGEVRLDLPGDQRANLGEFLSRFPGFRDQANLDTKINEVLDRVVGAASDGRQTWTADIDPWFAGELAFSVGELPPADTLTDPETMPEAPEAVAYLSLKDAAKARAWFDTVLAEAQSTTEDYKGTTLTVVEAESDEVPGGTAAYGIPGDGRVAVLGQIDAVKAALDTGGNGGLADDPDFAAALATSGDDHVGYLFLNMRTYIDWAMSLAETQGEQADQCGASLSDNLTDLVPAWVATRFRVEKDALAFGAAAPKPAKSLVTQENRVSTLAKRLPASTILFSEGHDLGDSLLATVDMYRDDPACAEALGQVEMAVGFLGGFDDLLGWMGDGAVVVNRTATGIEGGLVFQASDADGASDLLETIESLIGFAGAGSGVSVRQETHGDATLTILDLGDVGSLSALGSGMGGVPVPAPGDPNARAELAWTSSGDLVVIGVGTNFVKSVLDTEEGDSLASNSRYSALLERTTGTANTGVVFADLTAIRELVEGLIETDTDEFAKYEAEAKPFLEPFDAFLQSSALNGDRADTKALLTVK